MAEIHTHTDTAGHASESPLSLVGNFGDVASEFRALRSSCGIYSLASRAKISLTGADRTRWLNGMVTNNIRDLAQGQGVYAFLLNPQGHILGDLIAYNRGTDILVDVERPQLEKILGVFDHYIIMDDVEVADISRDLAGIGLAGPNAVQALKSAGFDVPETLGPMQLRDISWRGASVTLVKRQGAEDNFYELWVPPDQALPTWEALVAQGAKPVGTEALELNRIAQGIARYGQDIRERDLPQETGQAHALHFSKGCYIGQEIVERIRSRGNVHRQFVGFLVEGPLPAAGAKVKADSKDVGEITSSATLPLSDRHQPVALGYVRREAIAAGTVLQAGEARVTVSPLPFTGIS